MRLNKPQELAVCHGTGPMLVLAGPGSGKTAVITHRINHLVNEKGVRPEHIMVVTFTRAAANEMKQRFASMSGRQGVLFGTFHSIFFLILKNAYRYSASDILSDDEQYRFILNFLRRTNYDIDDEKEDVTNIISEISKVKSEMYDIEEYYSLSCPEEIFRNVYKAYDKWLKSVRKIDFDDMMVYTYQLFSQRPDILAKWSDRFRYILVDEFQDINYLQYKIIRMIAAPLNNLFVVGDDDQAIYSFRGSKPDIMLNLEKDYPDLKKVLLDINYRCSANIIDAAGKLISNNKKRFKKKITAFKGYKDALDIKEFENLYEENAHVADLINRYIKKGYAYQDIAVLYRTNRQPQALIQKLLEYNIPISLKGGVPNIYEHWLAKDILAYVYMALGDRKREHFVRVMNRPKRYISRDAIDEKEVSFNKLLAIYDDKSWMCERIIQMESDIRAISRMTPARGIRYIDRVIGYGEFLSEYADDHNLDEDSLRDVLEQIYHQALMYDNYQDWLCSMEEYSEWIQNKKPESDAVSLLTLHGSKGLEYKKVIIVDVNEEIIPHKMSSSPEEMEEERRMFYVGMTRAKENLHLFSVKNRYNKKLGRSMFLDEIE